jgi:uncharacterized membrane protein YdjX (TVP38/TMEM64 family)
VKQLDLSPGRLAALTVAGLALLAAGILWGPDLYRLLTDREAVQAWVAGLGGWGPLATILLNVAQVVLAPVPGQTVGLVNGYLFGVGLGTLYSLIGVELGSALVMGLTRWLGRPFAARLVGESRLARWDGIARAQGPAFFFLVFLFPFVPDDVTCFIIGLSPLSIPYMLLLAAVGRLPGLLVASWVGARAAVLSGWEWALLGGAGVVIALTFWRYHARLEAAVLSLIEKLRGSRLRGGDF